MIKPAIALVALMLSCCAAAGAQQHGHDPIADALISPEVIMGNQAALGLTDVQRSAINSNIERAQVQFVHLQFQLSAAVEKLAGELRAPHVDRPRALAALDAELALERQVKRTQIGLMIDLKNTLTSDQQDRARHLAAPNKP